MSDYDFAQLKQDHPPICSPTAPIRTDNQGNRFDAKGNLLQEDKEGYKEEYAHDAFTALQESFGKTHEKARRDKMDRKNENAVKRKAAAKRDAEGKVDAYVAIEKCAGRLPHAEDEGAKTIVKQMDEEERQALEKQRKRAYNAAYRRKKKETKRKEDAKKKAAAEDKEGSEKENVEASPDVQIDEEGDDDLAKGLEAAFEEERAADLARDLQLALEEESEEE